MRIGATTIALFSVVLGFLPAGALTQICHRLNPLLFERCLNVGYNNTAHFPNNFTFHEQTIAYHFERDIRQFKQCSRHLDIMMCAMFVPKCVEDNYSPVLPCRRVCEEFVRDCEPKVDYEKIEWIKGLCRLLPPKRNETDSADDCLIPANYKPRHNSTTPLIQNCAKLQMSSCSHLGYAYTTQSRDMQLILNNVLEGKLLEFGNHSMCSSMLRKIFCAEFAPPCFPEDKEDIVLHTVCKADCENVKKECPELYSEHFGEYSFCEEMATEKSDLEGFCKLTKWPTAVRWPAPTNGTIAPSLRSPVPSPSPSKTTSYTPSSSTHFSSTPSIGAFVPSPVPLHTKVSTPVVVIVVSTVVIVMSIIGIVFLLVLRQRRRCTQGWTVRGYRQQLNEWETTVSLKT